MKSDVKAGQVYRAKVRHGHRYVLIEQVRTKSDVPYALWREILPSGKNAIGWLHGVNRRGQARTHLRIDSGVWQMPSGYELSDME